MFSPTNLSPRNNGIQDLQDRSSISNDDFDNSDSFSEGTATMVTQKFLKAEVSFISKSEYENLENCLICNISFEKFGGVSQHHCRVCGASVCGPCSRRQINSNRVCDLCFLRCFIKKTEQRRKDQLNTKKNTITQLKQSQEVLKKEILQVQNDINDIKDNKFKEIDELKKTLQSKKEELDQITKDVSQHEEMLSKAETQLREEKQRQQDLEKQQIVYESQLKGIIIELDQKKKIIEQKQVQVRNLMDQKSKLTNTKSFLNYKNQNEAYNETDEENEEENNQEESVNHDNNQQQENNSSTNHYHKSSIVKRKNYDINEKQPNNNDKCYCQIF
ncbi:hypothetical protein ABPG74_021709 [Tetrahymena malaccensis]